MRPCAVTVSPRSWPVPALDLGDDEPLTKRGYADVLAAAAGTGWLRLPGRAALALGNRATSLTRSLRISDARFRAASVWTPRYPSARQGWMATAEALKKR